MGTKAMTRVQRSWATRNQVARVRRAVRAAKRTRRRASPTKRRRRRRAGLRQRHVYSGAGLRCPRPRGAENRRLVFERLFFKATSAVRAWGEERHVARRGV